MNKSNMIWIKADKSRNIYKISPSKYNKILHDKMNKIDNMNTVNKINKDTIKFTNKLNEKMHIFSSKTTNEILMTINKLD